MTRPRTLTIDLRKLTHSGIGRYLANTVPGILPRITADHIQLLGNPEEIAALGTVPQNTTILPSASAPHSLTEQALAFHSAIRPTPRDRRVLWVPHYNIPLLYRGPLVVTIHDLAPLELRETFGGVKRLLAHVLLHTAARRASAILTPSHFSAQRIAALLRPTAIITVTPLAVDASWPTLAKAPAPHAESEPYLLFVGNLKPNKNLVSLLEALRILGPKAPQLLVAGKTEGFGTADLHARTVAKNIGNRVRFLGPVSDAELIALYRGAAAFVMPSLYEGFGLPILEAMRYNCPVIASNAASLPEVAGSAARLVNSRDPGEVAAAITDVLTPSIREQLRHAGIAREAAFTYTQAIFQMAAVLNAALQTP